MNIALLQQNYKVGDLQGNYNKIKQEMVSLFNDGVNLVVTSELSLIGYPPWDLLYNKNLINRCWQLVEKLATFTDENHGIIVGLPTRNPGKGKPLFNSSAFLHNGKISVILRKRALPTYDVFDESRYFEPGKSPAYFQFMGKLFGYTNCEDIWTEREGIYDLNPVDELMTQQPVDYLINVSASPFHVDKHKTREEILRKIQLDYGSVPILMVNQIGGNDDLVFDGGSMYLSSTGELSYASMFEEDKLIIDIENDVLSKGTTDVDKLSPYKQVYDALVLGVRDYVNKCGFSSVVLGSSGGIDSALTAAIAVDAIGPENVTTIGLPSSISSSESITDARELAERLGVKFIIKPISDMVNATHKTSDPFNNSETSENIQARLRAVKLMEYSNNFGCLLLTTGNKSELAVGYCTIGGDMMGGLAVISDVSKTLVYKLCEWRNEQSYVIPENIITKPPSAELSEDQKDSDTLPEYSDLDQILEKVMMHYTIEETKKTLSWIDEKDIDRIYALVKRNEFKRYQAAPGIRVTKQAFGTGWKYPLACVR